MADLRRISEDEPAWAGTLRRSLAELDRRISGAEQSMPGGRTYRLAGDGLSPVTASEAEQRRLQHSRSVSPRDLDSRLEDGIDRLNTSGQRRDRMDAMLRKLEGQNQELRAMAGRLLRQPTVRDRNALASAYHRADSIYSMFGYATPQPMPGESPMAFRHRLADGLKKYSPSLRRTYMDGLRDDVFNTIEERIYEDAEHSAKTGRQARPMTLTPYEHRADTGHNVTEYFGDPMAWMAPFMSPGAKLTIRQPPEVRK